MAAYRLYCFEGRGKTAHFEVLEAEDDAHALRQAFALQLDVSCEVWDRDRLVGHVPAHEDSERL
jgi:hypothetical protein